MKCIVRQEVGLRFAKWGEQLEAIASETAPIVTAVTGLTLPDPVVIHTMTLRDWKKAHNRSSKRRMRAERTRLNPSVGDRLKGAGRRRASLMFMGTFWPLMMGESVEFEPGCPELVVVPEALELSGRIDDLPVLHKVLGHEMTHLAQHRASDGAVWAAQESFFPKLAGTADRDYKFLMEGHAYWADQQITAQIFGEPVSTDEVSASASDRYRKLYDHPLRKPLMEMQRRATSHVTQLIEKEGISFFNRVWSDPRRVPMKSDTSAELWYQRLQQ